MTAHSIKITYAASMRPPSPAPQRRKILAAPIRPRRVKQKPARRYFAAASFIVQFILLLATLFGFIGLIIHTYPADGKMIPGQQLAGSAHLDAWNKMSLNATEAQADALFVDMTKFQPKKKGGRS
jgi:hypothetical protein